MSARSRALPWWGEPRRRPRARTATEWWGGSREHEEVCARWMCGHGPPPGPGEAEHAEQAKRGPPVLDYGLPDMDVESIEYVAAPTNLKPVALWGTPLPKGPNR